MPVDILDDDDSVIHQYADGENQREQGYAIDRESPGPGREQRGGQRDDDSGPDNDRFAPAERIPRKKDDRNGCESEFLDQFPRLIVGGLSVVAGYRHVDALGDDRFLELG